MSCISIALAFAWAEAHQLIINCIVVGQHTFCRPNSWWIVLCCAVRYKPNQTGCETVSAIQVNASFALEWSLTIEFVFIHKHLNEHKSSRTLPTLLVSCDDWNVIHKALKENEHTIRTVEFRWNMSGIQCFIRWFSAGSLPKLWMFNAIWVGVKHTWSAKKHAWQAICKKRARE